MMPIPHFTTALTGNLQFLEEVFLTNVNKIEHWFRGQWLHYTPPLYASVDLRNAGFKLSPVDTNLFPAGFNNLNPDFLPLCVQAISVAIERICPEANRLILIPENHTRNLYYLTNIATLVHILKQAGFDVRIGTLNPEITSPTTLTTIDNRTIEVFPIQRQNDRITIDGFNPCAVLLNNDLSAGIPPILQNLSQFVLPPLTMGWGTRKKSQHFSCYDEIASTFSTLLGIDEWLINPYFSTAENLNFQEKIGEEILAEKVHEVLEKAQKKYQEYGIKQDPFVIVKANAGTYGMGIMTVKNVEEVKTLNRRQRNKMSVVKEGLEVSEVLIQEGVYTFEEIHNAVAEPVVYMIDRFIVGGFYRVHTERSIDENLNAPGMHFVPLAFDCPCPAPIPGDKHTSEEVNRFYTYSVIARLALLSAAKEIEKLSNTAG